MFENGETKEEVYFVDTKKNNRLIKKGSRVKLQITEVSVSEGTLILSGSLY